MSKVENPPLKYDRVEPILAWTYDIKELEGRLLTLAEATTSDVEQRKALKDMLRQMVWDWATRLGKLESESLDSPNFKLVKEIVR